MTFAAPIIRLSFLPLACLYAWIATSTGDTLIWAATIAMSLITAVMILRGIMEEPSPAEAGAIMISWGVLALSAAFPAASFMTPGICTDSVLTFEAVLAFFAIVSIITWSHLWSKRLYPTNRKGLTRSEQQWVRKQPVKALFGLSVIPFGIMALVIDRGACVPETPNLIILPLIALTISGYCSFALSAATRWTQKSKR